VGATFHQNDGEFPLVLCSEVVGGLSAPWICQEFCDVVV
jgi:hypothetical protein